MVETAVETASTQVTIKEFLALPESSRLIELVEGEIIMTPPPVDAHQKIAGDIFFWLRQNVTGGTFRFAPTGVYLDDENFVEPDLFWVGAESARCRLIENKYWRGAPGLIVEILSPPTARQDRGVKFDLYERHGVREYWIVDPEAAFLEVYALSTCSKLTSRSKRLRLLEKRSQPPHPRPLSTGGEGSQIARDGPKVSLSMHGEGDLGG
ncbi:MAG: Uma2 family endonuclease [Anaerolineae bacterium]|nr:Uma2 family endonuclease [Anaerolineae bacterium]